jgi:hypothetical protein
MTSDMDRLPPSSTVSMSIIHYCAVGICPSCCWLLYLSLARVHLALAAEALDFNHMALCSPVTRLYTTKCTVMSYTTDENS